MLLEISAREFRNLRHHAERDSFRAEDVTKLPQHLFHAHIRAHVAGAVVSGEQQLQLFARLPGSPFAQHPCGLRLFNGSANPGFEQKVHHAADPPTFAGQS